MGVPPKSKKGRDMKEVQPSVSILSHTEKPLETIYKAARQCYSAGSVADMDPASREKMAELVQRGIRSGHTSVLEHASFTFAISGVSRALSHQLVRHRMASYSQSSQRHVKVEDLEYVCPPSLKKSKFVEYVHFIELIERAAHEYQALIGYGVPAEDARFVLPQATATNIVMTMNCRALLHFFEERSCNKAQWEIHRMAMEMMSCMVDELPEVFNFAGPKCRRLGFCPEEKGCGLQQKKGESA